MSKVQLAGNASGTGIFTIASPNSNTDRTLTLPDNTGTLLTSAAQSIPKSALPTGSVLQVVQATTGTLTSSTTSTYADTAITTSITPTSATSKILVIAYLGMCGKTAADTQLNLRIQRSGSTIFSAAAVNQGAAVAFTSNITLSYLDSPATTSSTTYTVQLANRDNAGSVNVNNNSTATIILMEIAA
jgi:hypothetical protein